MSIFAFGLVGGHVCTQENIDLLSFFFREADTYRLSTLSSFRDSEIATKAM